MLSGACELCKTFRDPKADSNLIPLVADSTFFGPSIDESIIYILSFLPDKWLEKIGFLHKDEMCEQKSGSCSVDMDKWLKSEYMSLAKEVADCGWNMRDDPCSHLDNQMIESRKFVLNRLAELMEKKTEIEKTITFKED